jgi:hypothetical protein
MARLSLTPSPLPKTGASAPLNLTALIAAGTLGSNTGVTFANSGREFLVITVAAGGSTCTVDIGTTIEGQAVTAITPTLTASVTEVIGPFPADENQQGAVMNVDFGTPANVTVALLQFAGVN